MRSSILTMNRMYPEGCNRAINFRIGECFPLTETALLKVCKLTLNIEQRRGRSSVWLERLPVTQKAASSSLVAPAINWTSELASFFI